MVTGAGSGIGRAAARLFVGLGARVVLVGRGAETLRETAEDLPASEVLVAPCDVANEERVHVRGRGPRPVRAAGRGARCPAMSPARPSSSTAA
ncbi:SDR family NAD(P)-dependent oxidoreductase [Streptomyces abikoensis]|uniref:SDR family NAD(P)-dependent oxidoreductase n=1 Tax=Streptomyces abikoensis TaxID=97398 RepID=A0ABW7T805_9ACTN